MSLAARPALSSSSHSNPLLTTILLCDSPAPPVFLSALAVILKLALGSPRTLCRTNSSAATLFHAARNPHHRCTSGKRRSDRMLAAYVRSTPLDAAVLPEVIDQAGTMLPL
ncbi:hypothetical protein KC316_g76 [Hortaea werneckii]|nr:hypothetical protein KC316_g76 [Hortaea werneckii]